MNFDEKELEDDRISREIETGADETLLVLMQQLAKMLLFGQKQFGETINIGAHLKGKLRQIHKRW